MNRKKKLNIKRDAKFYYILEKKNNNILSERLIKNWSEILFIRFAVTLTLSRYKGKFQKLLSLKCILYPMYEFIK